MIKVLGTLLALVLIIAFGYPFARDAYQRYELHQRLYAVMTPQERTEFNQWNGDAESFARRLFDRCELNRGRGAVPCERYSVAFKER